MVTARSAFEAQWKQVHQVAAPDATDFAYHGAMNFGSNAFTIQRPTAAENSKKLYDSTAVWCVDRLASGIEALMVPQSEYWHKYDIGDFFRDDPNDEEKQWLERLRNLTFKLRYDADTNFVTAIQTCIRRCVAFGNAFMFLDEGWDERAMFRYMYMPLAQSYIAENAKQQVDTFKRLYSLTARQAIQEFGNANVSERIRRAADNPNESERTFQFLHCIGPRADYGLPSRGVRNAPYFSLHIEYDTKTVVRESGYYEFPIIDFRWMPEPGRVYGEGPVMKALADIQSLNQMAKNELVASEQAVKPPLLVAHSGVMNRPNASPNAITVGGLNAQGQRMVEPLMTGQRLDFAAEVLKAKREQVKESMYINLFALLVQNPQMSATEAMIRANEKGELLGPAGSRLQQSLSNMNERELGIMGRRGVFRRPRFRPPQSMSDGTVIAAFSSWLDRARQGKEVQGTMNLLNIISPIAQIEPGIVDNLNGDAMVKGLGERMGMPASFVRLPKEVEAIRQSRAQQQAMQRQAAIAKDLAAAGKQGVEAMQGMQGMAA